MDERNVTTDTGGEKGKAPFDLARFHLDGGEEDKARELVPRACNPECRSPEILAGWAALCEELGMSARALEFYRAAVRAAPDNVEAMFKQAVLLAEIGHGEEAAHCLKKILARNPEHVEARSLLAAYYRGLGLEGQARIAEPSTLGAGSKVFADRAPSARRFPVTVSRRDVETFLRLFSGKELGYATQRAQPPDGGIVFDFHREALSSAQVLSHLRGDITLAAYPLRSDNTARYAAVSIRARGSIARANRKNAGFSAILAEKAREHLLVLIGCADRAALAAYPEDCGGACLRLWFFFETYFHFLKIRKFVTDFLEHTPTPNGWLAVEPVLPTRAMGLGWEENPVLLPLGVHRATLRRCFFLSSEADPEAEQIKYLRRIRPIERPDRLPPHRVGPSEPASHIAGAGAARAAEIQKITSEQALKVYRGCAVIAELVGRALRARNLRHEEKLALFYSLGMVEDGPRVIHEVLENCPDYDCEKISRQAARLKPNPISCLKIRKLLPETASSVVCACVFDIRGGKYPSPVMHVSPHLVPTALEMTFPCALSLKRVAERFINLKRHQEETATALERLEALLDRGVGGKGLESIKVGGLRLERVEEGGKPSWKIAHP